MADDMEHFMDLTEHQQACYSFFNSSVVSAGGKNLDEDVLLLLLQDRAGF
jgi:hypothetical protein